MEIRDEQEHSLEWHVAELRKGGATDKDIAEYKRDWAIVHDKPAPQAPYGQCWEIHPPKA